MSIARNLTEVIAQSMRHHGDLQVDQIAAMTAQDVAGYLYGMMPDAPNADQIEYGALENAIRLLGLIRKATTDPEQLRLIDKTLAGLGVAV